MNATTVVTTPRLPGRWLGLAALTISGLVLGLDITILVTALPTLSAKLGATTDQLQWMSAAYTLALAGFMLPAGVLGDRLGRKRMLLVGLLTFGISSLIASQMTSANGLIVMRVVMGISGAIVLPLMQSMLPSMFLEDERQRAIGLAGAGSFIGLPLGPLLAGWLLTHYEWGSIFLINAPVVVIAAVGVWFFVPESKDPAARRLDWIGAILEVLGVSGIVYGIIEQPIRGWTDAQVWGPITGGAVLVVAFVMWQLRTRFPLVDLKLFASARFSSATMPTPESEISLMRPVDSAPLAANIQTGSSSLKRSSPRRTGACNDIMQTRKSTTMLIAAQPVTIKRRPDCPMIRHSD